MRHEIGIDKLMWGADYPHLEGAAPVHREILRYIFGGLPEEDVRRILGAQRRRPVGLRRRPAAGGGRPGRPDRRGPGDAARARRHRGHLQLEPGPSGAAGGRPRLLARGRRADAAGIFRRPRRRRSAARSTFAPENGRTGAATSRRGISADFLRPDIVTPPCFHDLDGVGSPCRIARGARSRRARPTTATARPSRSCTGCSSRFEAFVTEATAAFEASEEWAADGAKTAAAWIATRCRVPRSAAKRRVRLGRSLRHLPECAEAWRDGAIGVDQAQAIASARRHRTEASMARDEAMLVVPGRPDGLRGLLPGAELLEAAGRPRRGRRRRRGAQGGAQRLPRVERRRACGSAR